jgi:uncharacterized protein (TIGR02266 family)
VSSEKEDATFTESEDTADADRRQTRFDVDVNVTINSEHHFLAGSATNLSAGGIFIATHIVQPIGAEFNLSIHLDDGGPGVVHGKGEVRWHRVEEHGGEDVQGLGIRFTSIEGDGEARITRFLEKRQATTMPPSDPPEA